MSDEPRREREREEHRDVSLANAERLDRLLEDTREIKSDVKELRGETALVRDELKITKAEVAILSVKLTATEGKTDDNHEKISGLYHKVDSSWNDISEIRTNGAKTKERVEQNWKKLAIVGAVILATLTAIGSGLTIYKMISGPSVADAEMARELKAVISQGKLKAAFVAADRMKK
jgi:predicted nuclease with TOPRIM domain